MRERETRGVGVHDPQRARWMLWANGRAGETHRQARFSITAVN